MTPPASPVPHPPPAEPDVAVLLGPCDTLRAEVYVRLATSEPAVAARIEGTLTGPECRYAVTLPVTARLADLGRGPAGAALGRAILTEPSFWTPQMPSLYRLEARVVEAGRDGAACDRRVGLRRLGVRGRSFWLDGHRWVPRAVGCSTTDCDPETFRQAAAVALATDPTEAWLARCDEAGVAVLAWLTDATGAPLDTATASDRLATWARHPAVMLAVAPRRWSSSETQAVASATRTIRGTLLLGQAVDGMGPPPTETPASGLVVELEPGAVPHAGWRQAPRLPLVALRRGGDLGVAAGRRACDRLQADMAAWGIASASGECPWDWAGYAVT